MSELTGDVLIICTGGTPMTAASGTAPATGSSANAIPQMTVVFDLGAPVVSRILGDGGVSEALLMVDDPGSTAGSGGYGASLPDLVCPTPTAAAWQSAESPGCQEWVGNIGSNSNVPVLSTGGNTNTTPGYNIFPGVVSGNTVTFQGVPLLPPGPGGRRTFRITNIRVSVSDYYSSWRGTLLSHVTLQSPLVASDLSSSSFSLIVLLPGLNANVLDAADSNILKPPVFVQTSGAGSPGSPSVVGYLDFGQAASYGLRARTLAYYGLRENGPNALYWEGGESAFTPYVGSTPQYFAGNTSVMPGLADSGTRLKATFQNIPAGVTIYVATRGAGNTTSGLDGEMVASPTAAEAVPPVAPVLSVGGVGYVPLSPSGGTASVCWEIASRPNSDATSNLDLPVAIYAAPGAAAPGTVRVNLSFAPTPSDVSGVQFIPEFAANPAWHTLLTMIPAPVSFVSPVAGSTVTLTASGASVNVTGSADLAQPINFTAHVTYASGDAPWLNANFTGAAGGPSGTCSSDGYVRSTPMPFSLSLDCSFAKLSAGTHTATVTLTAQSPASAGSAAFYVQYTAPAPIVPALTATPANLTGSNAVLVAKGAKASATVQLSTTSATAVSFSSGTSDTWVHVSPVNGQVSASAPATATVTCDATTLSPRVWSGTVYVSYGGATSVAINVQCVVTVPALTFVPSALALTYNNISSVKPFGSNVTLETPNNDAYNLSASYPSGAVATNLVQVNGAATAIGLTDGTAFAVTIVNYERLPNGTYTATITATDASNPAISQPFPVTLTVTGSTFAALTLTPSQISLNASNGYQQTVTINAGAEGSLMWIPSVAWLYLTSSTSYISAGGSALMTVTADPSVTGPGTFTANISVRVGSNIQQLPVSLTVGGAPDGAVSGGLSVAGQVVFAGSGSFSISSNPVYSANSGSTEWLSTPTLAGNPSATGTPLTLYCNPAYLAPGTYTASLGTTITTAGGSSSASLPITFVVTAGQAMESAPPTVIMTDGAAQQSASIQITATGAPPSRSTWAPTATG